MQWYDQHKSFQYFVHIFWLIYLLVVSIAYLAIFVNNNSSTYTWFKNPSAPGSSLTSYRGTFNDVTIRMTIFAHIFIIAIIQSMIFFRDHNGLYIFWFTMYILMYLLTFLGLIGMGSFYQTCNQQNQYGNMCNSYDYCNVNEIRANPANFCPDPLPSATPVLIQNLNPNANFLGLFWTNFVLFILQMIFIGVISYFWYVATNPSSSEETMVEEQEMVVIEPIPKQQEEKITQSEPEPVTSMLRNSKLVTKRTHSLKKRN